MTAPTNDHDRHVSRGARGGVVTMLGQMVKLATQLVGVVVLSRLLSPTDFGLIAMVAVFVGLSELLRDFGMPTAALQARTLSHAQASNFFWANTALGCVGAALLVLSTPWVVDIYGQPELALIMPVLAVSPLLNGMQAQMQVRLARQMRFVAVAATDVAAYVLGLVVACCAALLGYGYWALVAQTLTIALTLLSTRWMACAWLPSLPARGVGSRTQLTSGSHFGLAQTMTYAASNADTLVIGARFGSDWAGYYNRAFQLLTVPINSLLSPLTQVVIPTVHAAVKSGHSQTAVLLRIQFALGFVVVGVFACAAAVAPSLIPIALGEDWDNSIPIFQILAIGGSVQVFSFVSFWAFILGDFGKQLLYYNLVTKPLSIILIVAGSVCGPLGIAAGYAAGLLISWPINLLWLARITGRSSVGFFAGGFNLLLAGSIAFAAGTWVAQQAAELEGWITVGMGLGSSLAAYIAVLALFPASRGCIAYTYRTARRLLAHHGNPQEIV